MVLKLTLQVAVVSVLVGVVASAAKQVPRVARAVQASEDPHLHAEPVQMLLKGAAHGSAVPHLQAPVVQVSESPLQASAVPHLQAPEVQVSDAPLQADPYNYLRVFPACQGRLHSGIVDPDHRSSKTDYCGGKV